MEDSKLKIIKEIAQNLDIGQNSYYNPKTDDLVSIPDFTYIWDEEDYNELFKLELEKVKKHKADFIKIEVLDSSKFFKIRDRFVAQLPDSQLKIDLETVLQKKKPFQNFKYRIERSDYRKT